MASSELLISEGKKGVSSTVPTKPQQHKRMQSTLRGKEHLFYFLLVTCCCNKLLDVLDGSSVAQLSPALPSLCLLLAGLSWHSASPHLSMESTLQGEEDDRFIILMLAYTDLCLVVAYFCKILWDVLYGSSAVTQLIPPLCGLCLLLAGLRWHSASHHLSTACRTSTDSHPHLDAEAEPCGIDSGHSSSQSTRTAQQAMPAYACSTKNEDQMPVALNAPSSTQAGGYPNVVVDSGASFHITGFDGVLQNPEHMTGSVFGITGHALPITGQGSIMGTPVPIWLDNVRYVHGLPRLLVSVSQITRARSARVVFEPDCCRVERISDGCTIGCGRRVGDLYTLECLTPV